MFIILGNIYYDSTSIKYNIFIYVNHNMKQTKIHLRYVIFIRRNICAM